MIRIHGVSKSFQEVQAIKNLSLEAKKGRVIGILGPNGCGKTTLIKMILGLVIPDSGRLEVLGESVERGYSYRKHLGYMPQSPDFPSNLRVSELLDMLEDMRGSPAPCRKSLEELFELGRSLERPFGQLSGGTKQKVAALTAFMFDPKILVLDEPTVGLDPVSAAKLKRLVLESVKNGKLILLVTHILTEIETWVDDLVFMLEGRVHFNGTLNELRLATRYQTIEESIITLAQKKGGSDLARYP